MTAENSGAVAHIFEVIAKVAKELGLDSYRIVSNIGEQAGQSVKASAFPCTVRPGYDLASGLRGPETDLCKKGLGGCAQPPRPFLQYPQRTVAKGSRFLYDRRKEAAGRDAENGWGDFSDWVSIRNCKETNMNIIKIMTPKALTVFLHTGDTVRQGLELLRQHGYTAIPGLKGRKDTSAASEGGLLVSFWGRGPPTGRSTTSTAPGALSPGALPSGGGPRPRRTRCPRPSWADLIPIVDDRNCFCGIVTRRSFMAFLVERTDLEELEASPV